MAKMVSWFHHQVACLTPHSLQQFLCFYIDCSYVLYSTVCQYCMVRSYMSSQFNYTKWHDIYVHPTTMVLNLWRHWPKILSKSSKATHALIKIFILYSYAYDNMLHLTIYRKTLLNKNYTNIQVTEMYSQHSIV